MGSEGSVGAEARVGQGNSPVGMGQSGDMEGVVCRERGKTGRVCGGWGLERRGSNLGKGIFQDPETLVLPS